MWAGLLFVCVCGHKKKNMHYVFWKCQQAGHPNKLKIYMNRQKHVKYRCKSMTGNESFELNDVNEEKLKIKLYTFEF
jgi:hypothetical protein